MSTAARLLGCNPTVVKSPWAAGNAAGEEPFSSGAVDEICIAVEAVVDPSVVAAAVEVVAAGAAAAGVVKARDRTKP